MELLKFWIENPRQLLCDDCGFNTSHSEYYMVKNPIWEEAQNKGIAQILCIGCLERRIGRKLVSNDFSDVPLNLMIRDGSFSSSRRLLERIGKLKNQLSHLEN